ncbi:MAG: 3-isopropylmalate dehydratase small subunit [Mariniblastus sp.]|nr:3-isopropylmalate dehydratase small subunit [Mariniblastus sp.]
MKSFTQHTGTVAAMDRSNVDTDQIIPKQFLKRIERTGFGQFLFYDWRFDDQGNPVPGFELNLPKFQGASILVARKNFGNGSSREHAVWALDDFGFRCVIAESFADIFYNNCSKNGVLPVRLAADEVQHIHEQVANEEKYQLTIDLESLVVSGGEGFSAKFEIDEFRRNCFLQGLDHIALTLRQIDKIEAFEKGRGYTPVV